MAAFAGTFDNLINIYDICLFIISVKVIQVTYFFLVNFNRAQIPSLSQLACAFLYSADGKTCLVPILHKWFGLTASCFQLKTRLLSDLAALFSRADDVSYKPLPSRLIDFMLYS